MDDVFLQSYWGSHATHPEGPSTTLSNKEGRILSNEDRAIGRGSAGEGYCLPVIFLQDVGEILQRCCYSSCESQLHRKFRYEVKYLYFLCTISKTGSANVIYAQNTARKG